MPVLNPYKPPDSPAVQYNYGQDLPPELQQQLGYASALDKMPMPTASPEAPSPSIGPIPGTALDYASPTLLRYLQSQGPAVRSGKGHDLANVLSVLGQTFLGSRIAGAQDRAQQHAQDIAEARFQATQLGENQREAHRVAGSTLARYRWDQARQTAAGNKDPMVDITTPEVQAYLAKNKLQFPPGTKMVPQSKLAVKPSAQAGEDVPMSDEDVATWGHFVASGGMPPAFGMGKSGNRTRILASAAQQMRAGGMDLNQNRAVVKGLSASFSDAQKRYDQTTAFENTALANSDVLERSLTNLSETNIPLFNAPVRSWDQNVLGKNNVVAFNAARRIVAPEFARLLTTANASGVLSDEGRASVSELLPANATGSQLLAALRVLKQDAANRKTNYKGQLDMIRGAFKNGGVEPDSTLRPQSDPLVSKRFEAAARNALLSRNEAAGADSLRAALTQARANGLPEDSLTAVLGRIRNALPRKKGR